jgi:hypothetical protein
MRAVYIITNVLQKVEQWNSFLEILSQVKEKGKVIPVTDRGDP